jgi:hypothetical protein
MSSSQFEVGDITFDPATLDSPDANTELNDVLIFAFDSDVEPGDYVGRCVSVYGPYKSRWQQWKVRLQFVLESGELVSMHANLGRGETWSRRITGKMKLSHMLRAAGAKTLADLVNPDMLWRVRVEKRARHNGNQEYSLITDVIGRET